MTLKFSTIVEKKGPTHIQQSNSASQLIFFFLPSFIAVSSKIARIYAFKSFFKANGKNKEALNQFEINTKYKGYIEKEKINANKLTRLENIKLPKNFKYNKILSISSEGRQKLEKQKPETIGQASRISGVSPSDISVLLVYLGR